MPTSAMWFRQASSRVSWNADAGRAVPSRISGVRAVQPVVHPVQRDPTAEHVEDHQHYAVRVRHHRPRVLRRALLQHGHDAKVVDDRADQREVADGTGFEKERVERHSPSLTRVMEIHKARAEDVRVQLKEIQITRSDRTEIVHPMEQTHGMEAGMWGGQAHMLRELILARPDLPPTPIKTRH